MEVLKFKGDDDRLFKLVGRLVMDENVLAYNNNYPFKTSPVFVWFIGMKNNKPIAFVPVKESKSSCVINNYWAFNDNNDALKELMMAVLSDRNVKKSTEAIVQTKHIETFQSIGFVVKLQWIKYAKMNYIPHEEKRV